MKNRLVRPGSIVAAIILSAALLCGCGQSNISESANTESEDAVTDTSSEENDVIISDTSDTSASSVAEPEISVQAEADSDVLERSIDLKCIEIFSNGLAWVYLNDNQEHNNYYGLIDESGKLVYYLATDLEEPDFNHGSFRGGYAWYQLVNGGDVTVIDSNGNEIYTLPGGEGQELTVRGFGDGWLYIEQQLSGFDSDSCYVYGVDMAGNETEKVEIPKSSDKNTYLGDGIAIAHHYDTTNAYNSVYNLNTGAVFDLPDNFDEDDYNSLEDGTGVWSIRIDGCSYMFTITTDDLASADAWNNWYAAGSAAYESAPCAYCFDTYGNGWFSIEWNHQYTFYSFDMSQSFTLPDYGDEVEINEYTRVTGGYVGLFMTGADGNSYVTALDLTGTQQYDPVKVDISKLQPLSSSVIRYGVREYALYFNSGFFIYDNLNIIAPTGQTNTFSNFPSDINDRRGIDGTYIYSWKNVYDIDGNEIISGSADLYDSTVISVK